MSESKRDQSLDIFKGFAILIVVVGHALQALLPAEGGFSHQVIRSFQMELFMFTSGMAFAYTYPQKATAGSMQKLIGRLLPVYLIWSYILFFLTVWASGSELTLSRAASVLYNSGFWYLRYLLLYELFVLLIGIILRHIPFFSNQDWLYYVLPIVGISVIWVGTHIPILNASMSSPLYFFLVLGLIFGKVKDRIGIRMQIMIAGIGIIGMILLIALRRLNILMPFFAIAAFWGISTQAVHMPKLANVFAYLGLRTLPIYAIHVCVLHGPWIETGFYRSLDERIGMPFGASVLLLSSIWLGICLGTDRLISKNKKLHCILFSR